MVVRLWALVIYGQEIGIFLGTYNRETMHTRFIRRRERQQEGKLSRKNAGALYARSHFSAFLSHRILCVRN